VHFASEFLSIIYLLQCGSLSYPLSSLISFTSDILLVPLISSLSISIISGNQSFGDLNAPIVTALGSVEISPKTVLVTSLTPYPCISQSFPLIPSVIVPFELKITFQSSKALLSSFFSHHSINESRLLNIISLSGALYFLKNSSLILSKVTPCHTRRVPLWTGSLRLFRKLSAT